MTTTLRKRGLPIVALVALVALVGIVFWLIARNTSAPVLRGTSFDMPIYSSLDELAAEAGTEIVGTVKGVLGREIDYGTANPDERALQAGIPTVFYEIEVSEVIGGTTAKSIVVATPDVSVLSFSSEITSLEAGERVLLFLKEQTRRDAPGIQGYDSFYVPVSLDNGVFDVLPGDIVRPRLTEAFVSPSGEVPTLTLAEVRSSD